MSRYIPLAVRYNIIKVSGGICYLPDCDIDLIEQKDDGSYTMLGKFAHIEGYKGPRYNPEKTDKERNSFENIILLCGNHHDKISCVIRCD